MIRSLAIATLALLLAAPAAEAQGRRSRSLSTNEALDRCDKQGGPYPEMLACVAVILEREDARLNRAYKAAMSRLKPAQQASLRTAQRQWIKDRDAECQAEYEQGGRQAGIYATMCEIRATEGRADALERRWRR